ncbi:competence protein ComFC [Marinococcus luteus]|uniref:Competence protein ComFC n=1 Tax=Marinococcus luteus TaxID=1122204 RepID=A0A1H2UAF9_9BACI|nr:ComF family protein [Marinococcus luteus]SDW53126.1 competence protein ComFC [Marinococcus luteus]
MNNDSLLSFARGYCLSCQERLQTSWTYNNLFTWRAGRLCDTCTVQLPVISGPACPECSAPGHVDVCSDCLSWRQRAETGRWMKNVSLFRYDDWMQAWTTRWKFRGDAVMAAAFDHDLRRAYRKHFPGFVPVPVPLTPARMKERRFNQAEVLAASLKVPYALALERPDGESGKQSKQTKRERLQTVRGFTAPASDMIFGRNILIIDDIYTTGATVREAAQVLEAAGAASTASLTLIRA